MPEAIVGVERVQRSPPAAPGDTARARASSVCTVEMPQRAAQVAATFSKAEAWLLSLAAQADIGERW